MAFTFNKIKDLTSTKRVEGLSLGGSVRLRYGTAVNDLSKDGAFADNSDNSLVTEKAIKTYVDTAVGVEDLWDRDSTNSYTYLKNTDNVGIGTSTPAQKLVVDGNILQTDGDYLATDQVRAINGDGLKLYDDGSNGIFVKDGGQVGIGTTNPSEALHIKGALHIEDDDSTDRVALISNSGDDGWMTLYANTTAKIHLHSGSDSYFNGGNVGIGTTSPSYKLTVADSTANGRAIQAVQSGTSGTNWGFQGGAYGSGATKNIGLQVTAEGATTNYSAIFEGGNVGIGTTSPDTNLHIEKSSGADPMLLLYNPGTSADNSYMLFATGDTGKTFGSDGFQIGMAADTNAYIIQRESSDIIFKTSNSEVMRIDSSGNVGIGTTSPSEPLHIYWSDSSANPRLYLQQASTGDCAIRMDTNSNTFTVGIDGTDDYFKIADNYALGTNDRLVIDTSGNVGIGQDNYDPMIQPSSGSSAGNVGYSFKADTDTGFSSGASSNTCAIVTAGSYRTYWDASGNVGIGTTSPDEKLHVDGNIEIPAGSKYAWDNALYNYISVDGSADMSFVVNGGVDMTIKSTGKVGIKTTSPNDTLSVAGTAYADGGAGTGNTVFGYDAGTQLASGDNYNTFIGHQVADADMTNATNNVGVGYQALTALTEGDGNVVVGSSAGAASTTSGWNVLIGYNAGAAQTTGDSNVYIGAGAADVVTTAANNVVIGQQAFGAVPAGQAVLGVVAIGKNALLGSGSTTTGTNGTVAIGYSSLNALTTGASNLAIGYQALKTHTTGANNMAIGYNAMSDTDAGSTSLGSQNNIFIGAYSGDGTWANEAVQYNIAIGNYTMSANLNGAENSVAIGYSALKELTSGDYNVSIGANAGDKITTGSSNTCVGFNAGTDLVDDNNNVLIGHKSGESSVASSTVGIGFETLKGSVTTSADGTVAIGYKALTALTSGAYNVAIGYNSGAYISTGGYNTFLGFEAGTNGESDDVASNTATNNVGIGYRSMGTAYGAVSAHFTAGSNTAVGTSSLANLGSGDNNVAIGYQAGNVLTTGGENTIVGYDSDTDDNSATNQTVIGSEVTGVADNSVTLGNADVTAVYMGSDSGATVHCGDINVQYEYIHVGFNYAESAGTFCAIPLRAGTRPFTTFVGNLEKACMIAPHGGTLEVINFRSEEVGGNPVVIGFHKATNGTEVPSDTPTVSTSVDMSGVADDTTTAFAFSLSNSFNRGDVLGFSIDPANDVNDCLMVITLKYDTTT